MHLRIMDHKESTVVDDVAKTSMQKVGTRVQPSGIVSRVRYVKSKKNERAPMGSDTVKSSSEKYNIFQSVVDPLLQGFG